MHLLKLGRQSPSPALRLVLVNNAGKSINRLGVHEHVEFDHVRLLVTGVLIIHRSVTAGDAFDAIVEIDQDFVQRQHAGQHDPPRIDRLGMIHCAALFGNQGHQVPDVLVGTNYEGFDHRLFNFLDIIGFGQKRRVVYFFDRVVRHRNTVNDAWDRLR